MLQFLRGLLDPLFHIMGATLSTFHGWGAPWWLSILMLTIIVRTLLFPLTFRQVKSMRKTQELKPEIDEVRKKYKGDSRKQNEEIQKIYQERGVNPLGGCLPIFVQFPIFIVLYYTIKQFEHLESFRTGGLLWFQDLTVRDPLFILPVLYVATMMVSQEISMRNTAPEQRKIMRFLPIVFGFMLSRFPAGLFVYWVCSNCITIAQNYIIYNVVPNRPAANAGPADTDKKPTSDAPEKTRNGARTPVQPRDAKADTRADAGSGANADANAGANGVAKPQARSRRKKKSKKRR